MDIDGAPGRTALGSSDNARDRCPESDPSPGVVPLLVLVIDDDPPSREILACILRKAGYLVVEAAAGPEGLRRLCEAPVDLVVTDLQMPGLSGWEVARAVRRSRPSLPVVLVTGNPEVVHARPDLRELVSAILLKPFAAKSLEAIVEEVTATRRVGIPAGGIGEARPKPPSFFSGHPRVALDGADGLDPGESLHGPAALQRDPGPDPGQGSRRPWQSRTAGQMRAPAGDKRWPTSWL